MIKKIAFIGAGSMADATMAGILKNGLCRPEEIFVINKNNKSRLEGIKEKYGVTISYDKSKVLKGADVVVLAVKPKDICDALHAIRDYLTEAQLVISMIAGITSDYISQELMKDVAIVRAMPNTSALICNSATAIAAGRNATEEDLQKAQTLFETVGTVTLVKEDDLHAVTGLSGSGPAYIYYLVEAMEEAAFQTGLDREVAKALVRQTLIGATEMLKSTEESPAILRKKITSEGGTTEAGLDVLKSFKYQEALIACIKRATARSIELGDYYTAEKESSQAL